MLSVCHVSPTWFSAESILGGGERYAEELARTMSRQARVKLVSFGPRALREAPSPSFERVILKSWTADKLTPFSPRLFRELADAEVIHCHQYQVLPTVLAARSGARAGKRVFITDLGGAGWTPGRRFDAARWATLFLPLSTYAATSLAAAGRPFRVIGGGVDLERYPCRAPLEHDGSVVFLGRLLPHKGVHFAIEGLPAGLQLHVVGSEADPDYRARLDRLAQGKAVRFHAGLDDEAVRALLRRAMALVHPTPVDARGSAGAHELFGLALVEAMACGCPVIASRAASLPEIVDHGVTGLLVPPNDPAAIRGAIEALAADGEGWRRLSAAARRQVEERFTWEQVVERCLAAYSAGGRAA